MVAPNGARRGKNDHPSLPLTDDEVVAAARACFDAGANGIHAHIRDDDGLHMIDAGRYRALLERLNKAVPGMYVQVTSEAAGRYEAAQQQQVMRDLVPNNVSVALREMVRSESDWPAARTFYDWARTKGVNVQHIVYSLDELGQFIAAAETSYVPGTHHLIQLVLGTYDGTQISRAKDVQSFVDRMADSAHSFDWMLCAFGPEETECLVETHRLGGKLRIGFENSLWHADGSLARDNAERVAALREALADQTPK